ncbi:MAG: ATP-dependent helicase [Actinomycetota bacterium]|nr:ATP-dependent helicase [Actinomycetota bacterium]MDK1291558.1 ATP-dependent helicase [Actinomycetota bacterium]
MFDTDADDPAYLEGLNADQRLAVLHGDGPLLVIAGAGSGKTKTLASRVAHLIDRGVPAERMLLLTFTRRASAEMLKRAGASIEDRSSGRVWGGTFHSISNRLLRQYGRAVGLDEGFTVIDRTDTELLFGILRTEHGYGKSKTRFPRKETIAAIYSRVANAQTLLSDTLEQRFPWCRDHVSELKTLFVAYTARKREHNVIDYDDLLLFWQALLVSNAGDSVRGLFDHVLVDEYQDTNLVQADILRSLCGPDGNLTVVGDDAQSIYSFRAARVENILGFPEEYQGATVVTLEQNYRSTPQILAVSNAVIGASDTAFDKQLWTKRPSGPIPELITCYDEAAQADWVCDRVLELREQGIDLRDQAVLFRTGHHSGGLEIELARRNIPFVKFGGLKFLEAAHVKDLLSLLRILDNPRDELAWNRVLLMLPGVGPATAGKILAHIEEVGASAGTDALDAFCTYDLPVANVTREVLGLLRDVLNDCRADGRDAPRPAAQIDRLSDFCRAVFERMYDDAGPRLGDIEHLASLAADYPDRSRFLTEITLDPPNSTSDFADTPHLDDDFLILSTIHSAKGGEWRAVTVIHAADGNIPSDMALGEPGGLEEERRLLYVALTRAKDHLTVTVPQRYYHHRYSSNGKHSYALPSRFLDPAMEHFVPSAIGAPQVVSDVAWVQDGRDTVGDALSVLWE